MDTWGKEKHRKKLRNLSAGTEEKKVNSREQSNGYLNTINSDVIQGQQKSLDKVRNKNDDPFRGSE